MERDLYFFLKLKHINRAKKQENLILKLKYFFRLLIYVVQAYYKIQNGTFNT